MTPSVTNARAAPTATAAAAPAAASSAAPQQAAATSAAPAPAAPVAPPRKTSVDLEEGIRKIEDIVERMNQEMKSSQRGLSFSFDRAISTHVVTVKSAESGEVIRQIPTEAVIRVAHNIEKVKGLLFDGKY